MVPVYKGDKVRPVARGGGGGGVGGVGRPPPPVAHPKDFVPPFSNFVPPFSNFVPPLEYVDDVTRAMSKGGGGACECPRGGCFPIFRRADDVTRTMSKGGCLSMSKSGGVFQIDDVTRAMSKGGGVRLVFHPSKFRPPPHMAGWLRACKVMCLMWARSKGQAFMFPIVYDLDMFLELRRYRAITAIIQGWLV